MRRARCLYVGKARNLKRRVASYFRGRGLDRKTLALMGKVSDIGVTVTNSETEALLLEQSLIKAERPPYNIVLRDDKSYPYIHLTEHAEVSAFVLPPRRQAQGGGAILAPFPRPAPCARASTSCRSCSHPPM